MSYSIQFVEEQQFVIVAISGIVSSKVFINAMAEIVSSSKYPDNINAVYDLSEMDFDNVTTGFLQFTKHQVRGLTEKRAGAKTVYVCPKDLQFGMARMWKVMIDDIPVDIHVVRSLDEAVDWISR